MSLPFWGRLSVGKKVTFGSMVALLPMLVIVYTAFSFSNNASTSSSGIIQTLLVKNYSEKINGFLHKQAVIFHEWTREDIYGMAIDFQEIGEIKDELNHQLAAAPGMDLLLVTGLDGKVLYSSDGQRIALGESLAWAMPLLQKPAGHVTLLTSELSPEKGEKPSFLFSFPTHDTNGKLNGLFLAFIQWSALQQEMDSLRQVLVNSGFPNASAVIINWDMAKIIDRAGADRLDFTPTSLLPTEAQWFGVENDLKIREINDTFVSFAHFAQGQAFTVTTETIETPAHLLLVALIPHEDVHDKVQEMLFNSIAIAIAGFFLILVTALLISKTLTNPIVGILDVILHLSAGDLSHHRCSSNEFGDEIARIGNGINLMADNLQASRASLEASYEQIRQQNKELLELDQMKDDFLANITHEFKTPLNGILGLGRAILDGAYGGLPDTFSKPVGHILASADRLLQLALQILSFDSKKQTSVNLKNIKLQDHLDDFLGQFAGQAIKKGIDISSNVDPELQIRTDPEHLNTILMNLVGNSIKFTHRGYVKVSVRTLGEEGVALSVEDTGIGIPKEFHSKIFERFQQGFASESRIYEGSGLGLAIMKQSLAALNGAIHLHSIPGAGSIFTILLPLQGELSTDALLTLWENLENRPQLAKFDAPTEEKTPQPAAAQADKPEINSPPPGESFAKATEESLIISNSQMFILVVDDDAINREVIRANLGREFEIVESESGVQCLQLLEENDFDLVLLDLMMPGMSGYDVLDVVKRQNQNKTLPVIVLSAKDQSAAMSKAFHMGAVDYVTKPFIKEELMARIMAHVTLRRNSIEIVEQKIAENKLLLHKDVLERSNQFIRKTFGRYMSDEVVESILDTPEGLQLGGEKREVTILMTDLRGFTAIGERMPPEQVLLMLNMYLDVMTEIITKYQGTIIEFLGDGILTLFGAPVYREDDAQRAVACALAMQQMMDIVNARNRQHGYPEIMMGGGINTGQVIVGNIGSEKRSKYGVVGSTINLASRIESLTVGGQTLISESTFAACGPILRIDGQWEVMPKGVARPMTIYHVGGIERSFQISLPKPQKKELRPINSGPRVNLRVMEAKHAGQQSVPGRITAIGLPVVEIKTELNAERLTTLNIQLFNSDEELVSDQLYAKIVDEDHGDGQLRIHLTSSSPEADKALHDLL
ncbi:MAG: adenylate/guanylate cyclase [Magnetococcales bacterium]|nr:adenylate/guanylate cyclase [Magnetococcales bacterium]HIJ83200.1 response regulator [Magnetococcales bacterium]